MLTITYIVVGYNYFIDIFIVDIDTFKVSEHAMNPIINVSDMSTLIGGNI